MSWWKRDKPYYTENHYHVTDLAEAIRKQKQRDLKVSFLIDPGVRLDETKKQKEEEDRAQADKLRDLTNQVAKEEAYKKAEENLAGMPLFDHLQECAKCGGTKLSREFVPGYLLASYERKGRGVYDGFSLWNFDIGRRLSVQAMRVTCRACSYVIGHERTADNNADIIDNGRGY